MSASIVPLLALSGGKRRSTPRHDLTHPTCSAIEITAIEACAKFMSLTAHASLEAPWYTRRRRAKCYVPLFKSKFLQTSLSTERRPFLRVEIRAHATVNNVVDMSGRYQDISALENFDMF